MEDNKPLDEKEQAQLIEIVQLFMQLPNRDKLELHFYADTGGSLMKESTTPSNPDDIVLHFHDLEEGVALMRWYAHPEQDEENTLFLAPDTTLE